MDLRIVNLGMKSFVQCSSFPGRLSCLPSALREAPSTPVRKLSEPQERWCGPTPAVAWSTAAQARVGVNLPPSRAALTCPLRNVSECQQSRIQGDSAPSRPL